MSQKWLKNVSKMTQKCPKSTSKIPFPILKSTPKLIKFFFLFRPHKKSLHEPLQKYHSTSFNKRLKVHLICISFHILLFSTDQATRDRSRLKVNRKVRVKIPKVVKLNFGIFKCPLRGPKSPL